VRAIGPGVARLALVVLVVVLLGVPVVASAARLANAAWI
jgi:hypothetical protein